MSFFLVYKTHSPYIGVNNFATDKHILLALHHLEGCMYMCDDKDSHENIGKDYLSEGEILRKKIETKTKK